jgi:hypothetical protein
MILLLFDMSESDWKVRGRNRYVCHRSNFDPLTKTMQFWPPNFPNYAEKPSHVLKKGS